MADASEDLPSVGRPRGRCAGPRLGEIEHDPNMTQPHRGSLSDTCCRKGSIPRVNNRVKDNGGASLRENAAVTSRHPRNRHSSLAVQPLHPSQMEGPTDI